VIADATVPAGITVVAAPWTEFFLTASMTCAGA